MAMRGISLSGKGRSGHPDRIEGPDRTPRFGVERRADSDRFAKTKRSKRSVA